LDIVWSIIAVKIIFENCNEISSNYAMSSLTIG